ncbi:tetratricopeptide repeat protein, partial [Planktomarina temperata]|nr:tetratricopeptide repeat protein [Planktomarina temperata]
MTELTIDQALQKAIAAQKAGQVQEADRLYTAILKAQPKHPDANHNMGVLAVGVGKVEQALPFLKTALEANPATAQFWLSYIDAFIKLERLEDARAVFDQAKSKGAKGDGFDKLEQRLQEADQGPLEVTQVVAELTPKKPNILDSLKLDQAVKLAKKKAKNGSPEEAKRIYQDILTKFPKNGRAINGLKGLSVRSVGEGSKVKDPPQDQLQTLINLYSQGQLQQALEQATVLLQQFSDSYVLCNIRGVVFKALGQLDASVTAYTRALAIKPDYAEALYNLGIALKELGELEEAIGAYTKALIIKPDNVKAYNNLGIALQEQGKLEEAIEAYNKALSIKSDNAEAYYNLGITLQEQGKLEEAIEAYTKAITIKPDYAEAYNNLGITLQRQGKLEEAIEAYTKALNIKPDYTEAYNNLGITLQEQGKLEEAIEAYTKALNIKPDNAESYNNIGVILKGQSKLEAAIEAYTRALNIKPNYAEAYNNLGISLQEQGKLEEAIEAYTKALTIKPNYAEAYNNLGISLQEQGKLEEAIEAYTKALNTQPNNAEAYYNLGITLQEQGKLEEAIEAYTKALNIRPDYTEAKHNLSESLKQHLANYNQNHALIAVDSKIKAKHNKDFLPKKDRELAVYIQDLLTEIRKADKDIRTKNLQIYKRSSVDLNCKRHMRLYQQEQIIPKFCFDCYKVQVEATTVLDLIRLAELFYRIEFQNDLSRKCFVEIRPDIPGSYKGLVYCRGIDEANCVRQQLDSQIKKIDRTLVAKIKRGCSEFSLAIPQYGVVS